MKLLAAPTLVAATLIAGVAADFQIYYEQELVVSPNGDENILENIRVFDGEPSCDDVESYASLPTSADASGGGYSRCEGCEDIKDVKDWDIEELELNPSTDWGHYTIYKGRDYQMEDADGGPLQGSCTRDAGDDYDCTIAIANTQGTRLFKCESPKSGIHSR